MTIAGEAAAPCLSHATCFMARQHRLPACKSKSGCGLRLVTLRPELLNNVSLLATQATEAGRAAAAAIDEIKRAGVEVVEVGEQHG